MTHLAASKQGIINPSKLEVAVVGCGAAGLAAARVLSRSGIKSITVFEKDDDCGGVWSYRKEDKERPMYRGLRTNLPREIMAYREKPWGGDGVGKSFVTHREVKHYLVEYAKRFKLRQFVRFGCQVKQLTVETESPSLASPASSDDELIWPKVHLCWEEDNRKEEQEEATPPTTVTHESTFDAVFICNGHYARPSLPEVPGLNEYFHGTVMHSIEYDDPSVFSDKVVLCVGGRASGSDVAREISQFAQRVYLSDTNCPPLTAEEKPQQFKNVCWVPRTEFMTESKICFGDDMSVPVTEVDVIIFCSGYDYDFPFINDSSNLELKSIPGERRVSPLWEQLWHAQHPNIAFLGLPHSILPFPLFELQAEAVTAYLTGTAPKPIPSLSERLQASKEDAARGGPKEVGRVKDTHYLGSFQWDYCRKLSEIARGKDEEIERFIATNKAIYDYTGAERKKLFPGGPDTYRESKFLRRDGEKAFEVLHNDVVTEQANGDETEPVPSVSASTLSS